MNDFSVNLKGYTGVVKPRSFHLPAKATVKQRSFLCESGIGCDPTPGTRRTIKGRWDNGDMPDTISSYDFEYVVDPEGKRLDRVPEEVSDVTPVQLASERTSVPEGHKTVQVRRKR